MEIEGAIALVTGGAQGLGLAIAAHLAALGARVVVADHNAETLSRLPEGLEPARLDVTQPAEVKAAVAEILARHERLDILVNNAGSIYSEAFVNLMNPAGIMHDYERFRRSLTVNLDSVFIVTSAVVEQMVRRRTGGAIVNISSISAGGNEGQTAYAAAKAGVNAMTVTWAKELGRWGIRCNAVAPGFIATVSTQGALTASVLKHIQDSTPLRRLGEASEVAQAVSCVIANDFINGAVLNVNGGLTI
ncbi:SDR family oxidoreductase [uncultured Thiodictyon sp.]|uniref:SDR family oxidoreductase n=1 Tax=uncultured Thiodictyon sp. TaxID=1846217 RepID=UPI0025CE0C9F|nr:SDR family oxidoreductase [uncultured Thiodictyon sp.]